MCLLVLLLCLALLHNGADAHSRYMLNRNCGTSMTVGSRIMGSKAVIDNGNSVGVTRNGFAMSSGETVKAGDTASFSVTTSMPYGEYAIEVSGGAYFSSGGCTGQIRIDESSDTTLIIPSTLAAGTVIRLWER